MIKIKDKKAIAVETIIKFILWITLATIIVLVIKGILQILA